MQIHYFEEGNVQLNSSKTEQLTVSGQGSEEATAKAVVRAIEAFEASYQDEIFKDCNELSEGAFRSLRRQLPMTKQKVDWDKVSGAEEGNGMWRTSDCGVSGPQLQAGRRADRIALTMGSTCNVLPWYYCYMLFARLREDDCCEPVSNGKGS